jgi:plasmid stability protein
MGDILIRNLDDAVIAAWKKRADANGRSLQAELHAELSTAVKAQRKAELIAQLRVLRSKVDTSKLDKEGWELIREDRDSR